MAKPGDIVRNRFGAIYQVFDYDSNADTYALIDYLGVSHHVSADEVDEMDLFRKVN